MIASLGLILLCQPGGEVFARGLGVPVPGPVIGSYFCWACCWRAVVSLPSRADRCYRGRRHGHQRDAACRYITDGNCGHSYRHHRRDHGYAADEPHALVTSLLVPVAVTLLLR